MFIRGLLSTEYVGCRSSGTSAASAFFRVTAALLVVGLVASTGIGQGTAESAARYPAEHAMDFSATALDGQPFAGSTFAGKTVLLDFWAVWCAPCITAFPRLNRLQTEFEDNGFTVLGLTAYSGSPADVQTFLSAYQIDYPIVVADEDLVERFGVIGYPTYFLVGPDGSVHRHYVGEMPDLYETVARDLEELRNASVSEERAAQANKEVL